MRREFRWKNSPRSIATEAYASRRGELALDRFSGEIEALLHKFEDLNGPKGGVDKRCTIEAKGRFRSRIASAQASSYTEAADLALHKLERSIVRARERQLTRPHAD
jgi:ribosome-associated translation inhibitor RaiA